MAGGIHCKPDGSAQFSRLDTEALHINLEGKLSMHIQHFLDQEYVQISFHARCFVNLEVQIRGRRSTLYTLDVRIW